MMVRASWLLDWQGMTKYGKLELRCGLQKMRIHLCRKAARERGKRPHARSCKQQSGLHYRAHRIDESKNLAHFAYSWQECLLASRNPCFPV